MDTIMICTAFFLFEAAEQMPYLLSGLGKFCIRIVNRTGFDCVLKIPVLKSSHIRRREVVRTGNFAESRRLVKAVSETSRTCLGVAV